MVQNIDLSVVRKCNFSMNTTWLCIIGFAISRMHLIDHHKKDKLMIVRHQSSFDSRFSLSHRTQLTPTYFTQEETLVCG